MKLGSSFSVPAAPDKTLAHFLDPGTMEVCLPGCEELSQPEQGLYQGTLVNEVAHVKFRATFRAEIISVTWPTDPSESAVLTAVLKGEDRRLGSTIKLDATLRVSPVERADGTVTDDESTVSYELEMAMWGKLGRLGESVIRRRSSEVERQFAEALTAVCAGRPVPSRTDGAREEPQRRGAAVAPTEDGAVDDQRRPAPVGTGSAPVAARRQRDASDWVVLSLATAAAFAYGIVFARRGSRR